MEVFSWLLEVANDTKDHHDGGRIVWSVSYVHDGPKVKELSAEASGAPHEEGRKKIVAKLEIQKDDIQAVLPIAKVMLHHFERNENRLIDGLFFAELGADEYGRPYWPSGIAGHEGLHRFASGEGCGRHIAKLLSS